jgi:hypothetical protein
MVMVVALIFDHLYGEQHAVGNLEFMMILHWLLLDLVPQAGLEGSERSEVSTMCEGFFWQKLSVLTLTTVLPAGVVTILRAIGVTFTALGLWVKSLSLAVSTTAARVSLPSWGRCRRAPVPVPFWWF